MTPSGSAPAATQYGAPAAPPDSAPINLDGEDIEVVRRRRQRRRKNVVVAIVLTTVYYAFAILYYTLRALKPCRGDGDALSNCTSDCEESWNAADAVYFATATMTTVGYGDLKPKTTENMIVTVIFLGIGFLGVFPSLALALSPFYQTMELFLFRLSEALHRSVLGKKAEGKLVDLDGDGLADFEEPPSAFMYYLKGVSTWLIMWLVTQFGFALVYQAMEPEMLPMGKALYLCIVTATTVGYGDVHVRDSVGQRLFASFHILYSVSSAAALLNTVTLLSAERKLQLRKSTLLQRQLDQDLIASLDKDNNGLDKLEFVVGMLTKLEILHWDDVEPFLAQFDSLDQDGSGRLDKADLMRMVEIQQRKMDQARLRKEAMAKGGAPGSAPADALEQRVSDVSEVTEVQKYDELEAGASKPVSEDAGGGAASSTREYGGITARNRERIAAGLPAEPISDGSGGRRQRRLMNNFRLPFLQIARHDAVRVRRPRHLRGKVTPG